MSVCFCILANTVLWNFFILCQYCKWKMEYYYGFNLHFFCMKLSIFICIYEPFVFLFGSQTIAFLIFPEVLLPAWLSFVRCYFKMHPNHREGKFEKMYSIIGLVKLGVCPSFCGQLAFFILIVGAFNRISVLDISCNFLNKIGLLDLSSNFCSLCHVSLLCLSHFMPCRNLNFIQVFLINWISWRRCIHCIEQLFESMCSSILFLFYTSLINLELFLGWYKVWGRDLGRFTLCLS